VYDAERHSESANITTFGDAAWWTLTTMSTVGYGDRFPTTVEGRLIAVGLMVAGIALLGVITGTIATWFVDRIERVEKAENRTQEQLDELMRELKELRGRLDPGAAPQLLDRFSTDVVEAYEEGRR
jgi:voltage-gated potassium channel